MNELKLGQRVRYARLKPDGSEHGGYGYIVSIHLSVDSRIQVRVHDGADESGKPQVYNIDYAAINCTEEEERKYFDHVRAVQARSNEINQQIKEIVTAGNKELEEMNTKFLGAPVALEENHQYALSA